MSEEKIPPQSKSATLNLNNLYLDPNNYRFIDDPDYVKVADNDLTQEKIQQRTRKILGGTNQENLRDLLDSFKKNGFLPVDQIQVQKIGDSNKYKVVEGNRRVATLKYLQTRYEADGIDLGALNPQIFSKLPVVFYQDADQAHHLILMGLKHISGNRKWPALNQAELIRNLFQEQQMPVPEIAKALAISNAEVQLALQTLALIDSYRHSEYGEQFSSAKYSLFREVLRSSKLKAWLEWDSSGRRAHKQANLERLFSWMSEEKLLISEEDEEAGVLPREAVLVAATHIRELATLVDDEQALSNLDNSRNLSAALQSSRLLGKNRIKSAIELISQEVGVLFDKARLTSDADRSEILHLQQKMQALLTMGSTQNLSGTAASFLLLGNDRQHPAFFTTLTLHAYRRLRDIKLEKLGRINLIAGPNNIGKSSLLEAVRLLCMQSDSQQLLQLVRDRAKVHAEAVDVPWFLQQIPKAELSATLQGHTAMVSLSLGVQEMEDKAQYLQSASLHASFDTQSWDTQIHFFERYPQRVEGEVKALCPCVFSSPFANLHQDLLLSCHDKSLKAGSKQRIVNFIREHIDPEIEAIELDQKGHFIVQHRSLKPNPDLTQFGEGVQRVFKIGLLFAGAENGVVIIDEFDNALHTSLLAQMAEFVYELAQDFNVQVFLSSHSKECIDAFALSSKIAKADVSGFCLLEKEGQLRNYAFSGERLAELIEHIDFDLRGKRDTGAA